MPDPEEFASMTHIGWFAYVRRMHARYDRPSIRKIMTQARACDEHCTLGRGTVASALRGEGWPTAQTARWLGMGIGGEALGEQFRQMWLVADERRREENHRRALNAAHRAQREHDHRQHTVGDEDELGDSAYNVKRRRQRDLLMFVAAMLMNIALIIWQVAKTM